MSRSDWRTCKLAEAEVIRMYIFEQWCREYQEEPQQDDPTEQDLAYERARNAADRVASNFADRHFG
jgi:hypothetical protein